MSFETQTKEHIAALEQYTQQVWGICGWYVRVSGLSVCTESVQWAVTAQYAPIGTGSMGRHRPLIQALYFLKCQ